MASLTIRKLDDAIKTYLRLRAARNGRSVEEEVRVILRRAHPGPPRQPGSSASPPRRREPLRALRRTPATDQARVTLIIGGGIAAYKSLDLIRRLKERHIRRPLRADQGRAAIRHAAGRQRAVA